MKKIIITTLEVMTLFLVAAVGMFLTFGDCADLSLFIWTKVLAVPVWLAFGALFVVFDRNGALSSQLPRELFTEE